MTFCSIPTSWQRSMATGECNWPKQRFGPRASRFSTSCLRSTTCSILRLPVAWSRSNWAVARIPRGVHPLPSRVRAFRSLSPTHRIWATRYWEFSTERRVSESAVWCCSRTVRTRAERVRRMQRRRLDRTVATGLRCSPYRSVRQPTSRTWPSSTCTPAVWWPRRIPCVCTRRSRLTASTASRPGSNWCLIRVTAKRSWRVGSWY